MPLVGGYNGMKGPTVGIIEILRQEKIGEQLLWEGCRGLAWEKFGVGFGSGQSFLLVRLLLSPDCYFTASAAFSF